MKVVIISPFQLRVHRGIERFTYSLAHQLAEAFGIEITIYTWAAKKPVHWGHWHEKIKIRKVPQMRYFQEWVAKYCYWFWIRRDNPEYTLLNFLFHGEDVLPKNRRYIYVLNYPASEIAERYKTISLRAKKFSNLEFIAVSEMVKREALPYIQGKKIEVIPNGVDMHRFCATKDQRAPSKTLRLITLAALEERKGMQFVIEALALLRGTGDIKYDIYGDGPYREDLLSLIEKLRLSQIVTVHPSVDNPENVLNDADIFCLLSRGEAFPLAPLEAMASGLPVIVSQYPPFNECITKEVGILVEREDPHEVAEAITSLMDYEKRQKLGNNGRSFVEENFSWNKIARKYYKILITD